MPLPRGGGITIRCQLGKLTTAENFKEREIQLTLTNRATHLCKCSGVACLLKYGPIYPYMLPRRISSFCVKGCKHKYRRNQKKIGKPWKSALLGLEAWLTPRYTPLPTCVTTSNLVDLRQKIYA